MSALEDAIQRIQAAAKQNTTGDPAAHATLLKEISNLRDAAETPADRLMRMRFHHIENLCVRVALELGVLQAIAAKGSKPTTATELATELHVDELLIIRTMRPITHARIVDEIAPATYAGNATTELITTPGGIGGEKHHTDLGFAVGSKLIPMIREGKLHLFPDESPEHISSFEYTFGKPIFEYLQYDREQKEAFDSYMAIRREGVVPQWFEMFPVAEKLKVGELRGEEGVLVVDVGGGMGHEIGKFRERFGGVLPGRLVLQDLGETVMGSEVQGVEVMEHDFFTEQPVQGAKIYYMRQIMHDWSPKSCAQILSHIAKAMDPEYSRILIDDYVLPDTGADRRAAAMDFLMFMFAQGMERSISQWETLLEGVGLEIVKIWQPKTGLECVIEAKVKKP